METLDRGGGGELSNKLKVSFKFLQWIEFVFMNQKDTYICCSDFMKMKKGPINFTNFFF